MQFTFLVGSERSGSNLITRMVGNHPDLCGPPPTHLIRILAVNRHAYGDLADDEDWRRLIDDAVALLQTRLGTWRTSFSAAELHAAVRQRTLAALLKHIHEAEARAHGASHLFVKEIHIQQFLPFLLTAFDEPTFVGLVRDPRDMALSWKRSPVLRGDVVRAARRWRDDQETTMALMAQLGDAGRIVCLRYEDLVSDPATELERLCTFLNAPMDPAMLTFHDSPEATAAAVSAVDWANLAQPVMSANFGKYRAGLTTDEIAYVEAVCQRGMAFFGYTPESASQWTVAELESRLLPWERHEKPGYARVDARERDVRARRAILVRSIEARCREREAAHGADRRLLPA